MGQDNPLVPQTPAVQGKSADGIGDLIRNSVGGVLHTVSAELAKELTAATKERNDLQAQLNAARPGGNRAALSQRLAEANIKVDKLQAAIDKLDSKADNFTFAGTTAPPPPPQGPDYIPENMIISVIGIIFIGFPLSIAFARIMWRRATRAAAPPSASQLPADSTRRFDQIEHAVDAIAIEVERISENQRYLTKLLSEPRQNAAVGSGRGGPPPAS